MSLELCVLASGSAGNCSVLRTGSGALLIDAGLGPRATGRRLLGTGVDLSELRAILLTHPDADHFNPTWFPAARHFKVSIYCAANHVPTLRRLAARRGFHPLKPLLVAFKSSPFQLLPSLTCHPLRLAHDRRGSQAFLLDTGRHRLGYATDFGQVPPALIDLFTGVDLLAIESNYDPRMELASNRPWSLKQRIMGRAGHLSNPDALSAVRAILDETGRRLGPNHRPHHIVLLHRSRHCNCPVLLRRLFTQDQRIAPILTLAHQDERTEWLGLPGRAPLVGEQLCLFHGENSA